MKPLHPIFRLLAGNDSEAESVSREAGFSRGLGRKETFSLKAASAAIEGRAGQPPAGIESRPVTPAGIKRRCILFAALYESLMVWAI
jgi:hypothetical protein